MSELTYHLNRLAGTTGLAAQGAANAWAGTTQIELVGVLNRLAHTQNLEINGALKVLARVFEGDPTKDGGDALDAAIKFTLYPLSDLFPESSLHPGVV